MKLKLFGAYEDEEERTNPPVRQGAQHCAALQGEAGKYTRLKLINKYV